MHLHREPTALCPAYSHQLTDAEDRPGTTLQPSVVRKQVKRSADDSELLRLVIDENVDNSLNGWDRVYSTYRTSIYCFIRKRGFPLHEAEDLTQRFFVFLIGRGFIKKADLERGNLKTFLLMILKSFLSNDWQNRRALKRGGEFTFVSFDDLEERLGLSNSILDGAKPVDARIERGEALQILQNVVLILEEEYAKKGKLKVFRILEPGLTGEPNQATRQAWGNTLEMSPSALRVALHRLRRRFGEVVKSKFSQDGQNSNEVNQNIRHFFGALVN